MELTCKLYEVKQACLEREKANGFQNIKSFQQTCHNFYRETSQLPTPYRSHNISVCGQIWYLYPFRCAVSEIRHYLLLTYYHVIYLDKDEDSRRHYPEKILNAEVSFSGSFLNRTLLNNQFSFEDKYALYALDSSTESKTVRVTFLRGRGMQRKKQCVNLAEWNYSPWLR